MQTKLKGFWDKIKGFFTKLNKKTRILLGVCAGVILVLIVTAAILLNRTEYELLQGGLNASEISTLVGFLDNNGVKEYKIDGDKVYVSKGRAQALQGQLALSGNLTSGFLYEGYNEGVGALTTSSQEARLWLMAREQKLAAIIQTFEGVQSAQVTITPGTERIYVLDPQATPATASVIITPTSSKGISSGVVESIRDLVSHSVEGLEVSNVSISDTLGNPYGGSMSTSDAMGEAGAMKLQYEQETSNKIRGQVLQALEDIYGPDNVRVAVSSVVDVNRRVIDSTTYHQPEGSVEGGGLIGKDQWYWEIVRDGETNMGGTVGTSTNSDINTYPDLEPNLNGDETAAGASGDRTHMIDSTKEQVEVLAFSVSDVQVAVTINQNCTNANALSTEALSSHVATAAGIGNETPGSHVSVVIAPFDSTTPGPVGPLGPFADMPGWVLYAAIGGLILFIILLIIILLLRSRAKKRRLAQQQALEEEMQAAEAAAMAAAAAAAVVPPAGGADIMEVNTEKSMELRKNVRQFAQNNPEIAAQMVKAWLRGETDDG